MPLHVPKLRYDTHVQEYTLLLYCAESCRRDNAYILYLGMLEENICLIVVNAEKLKVTP